MKKLTKKDARILFKQFFSQCSPKGKDALWNKLVPYANEYPELYNEYKLKVYKNRKIIKWLFTNIIYYVILYMNKGGVYKWIILGVCYGSNCKKTN